MEKTTFRNFHRFRARNWLTLLGTSLMLGVGQASAGTHTLNPWNREVLYFAFTDRFHNGDPSNDSGTRTRAGDEHNPGSPIGWHGGDFQGITQKIEEGYFERLGVTALWISPVYLQTPAIVASTGPHQGKHQTGYHSYWPDDFFEVDPHFGTVADLRALVQAAHQRGLKVVQDVIVNHAGYNTALLQSHPEWFNTARDCQSSTLPRVDCPLGGLPDFRQQHPEVTRFLNDHIQHWLTTTGVDGLRMDTMQHATDGYWTQFFAAGGVGDPAKVWTVGEVLSGDVQHLKHFLNDLGTPALFDFPLQFAIKDHLTSERGDLNRIASVFDQDALYNNPEKLVTLVDNHDVPRFMSEALAKGISASEAKERLDLALSLIFTSRGTPSVYYGTEIGMIGKGDPYHHAPGESNREDMDFSRLESSTLDERIKALADARQASPALQSGDQHILSRPATNGGAPLLAFRRTLTGADPVVVLINNSNAELDLSTLAAGKVQLLGTFAREGTLTELTGKTITVALDAEGNLTGKVPARGALVLTAPGGTAPENEASLPGPAALDSVVGHGAVKLSWQEVNDPRVAGYRVLFGEQGRPLRPHNLEPARASKGLLIEGLDPGKTYTFQVVGVGTRGQVGVNGPTVTLSPQALSRVTFTVDARSQGDAQIQLRTFSNGENRINLTPVEGKPGFWTGTLHLPIFKKTEFKFGNASPAARNSGYEGTGFDNRDITPDEPTENIMGVYNFITVPAPDHFISGEVTSAGKGVQDAVVESDLNPGVYFAFTWPDGSYHLPLPDARTVLTVSKAGHQSVSLEAGKGTLTQDLALTPSNPLAFTIDGDLSDWTSPGVTVQNRQQGYDSKWGAANLFKVLQLHATDTHLYLAYQYTASGNAPLVYLDVQEGGFTDASGLRAWPRKATFTAGGIDLFVAQYQADPAQLWLYQNGTLSESTSFAKATRTSPDGHTTELAIPWAAMGLGGKPASVKAYAGIFGDNWGAGDIVAHLHSSPAFAGNTIQEDNPRNVIFGEPVVLNP